MQKQKRRLKALPNSQAAEQVKAVQAKIKKSPSGRSTCQTLTRNRKEAIKKPCQIAGQGYKLRVVHNATTCLVFLQYGHRHQQHIPTDVDSWCGGYRIRTCRPLIFRMVEEFCQGLSFRSSKSWHVFSFKPACFNNFICFNASLVNTIS